MKALIKICCFSFVFLLSSCATFSLWWNKPISTNYSYKQVTDSVRAFGKTQEKNNERLVMMGDEYWYFIDAKNTPELLKLLNTKLPKAFQTSTNSPFNINIHDDAKTFDSFFILYYAPQNTSEVKTLKDLGFRNQPNDLFYKKDFKIYGEIYRANKDIRKDYQFETALPVLLKMTTKTTEVHYLELIGKITATPFAVAADIISIPIFLPILFFITSHP